MKKTYVIGGIIIGAILLAVLFFNSQATAPHEDSNVQESATNEEINQESSFDKSRYSTDELDSIWLVVNKERPIDIKYVPSDLVDVDVVKRQDKSAEELMLRQQAAVALENMFNDSAKQNINLMMGSAYRSADLQADYYNNYVATYGQKEADKFSAKPGTSEHQIGLSADVSRPDKQCYLEVCFAETAEGKWVAQNAHKYGFIIRYPKGKEDITGYQYEPWHLRYVDKELAAEIFKSQQTIEEFFGL